MNDLIWYEKWLLNFLCRVAGPHGEFIVGDMLEELGIDNTRSQALRFVLIAQNILLLSLHRVKSKTVLSLLVYVLFAQVIYFAMGLMGQVAFLSHAYALDLSLLSINAFFWGISHY